MVECDGGHTTLDVDGRKILTVLERIGDGTSQWIGRSGAQAGNRGCGRNFASSPVRGRPAYGNDDRAVDRVLSAHVPLAPDGRPRDRAEAPAEDLLPDILRRT